MPRLTLHWKSTWLNQQLQSRAEALPDGPTRDLLRTLRLYATCNAYERIGEDYVGETLCAWSDFTKAWSGQWPMAPVATVDGACRWLAFSTFRSMNTIARTRRSQRHAPAVRSTSIQSASEASKHGRMAGAQQDPVQKSRTQASGDKQNASLLLKLMSRHPSGKTGRGTQLFATHVS